jgi:hypothetical protein
MFPRFLRLLGIAARVMALPLLLPAVLILMAIVFLWDAEVGLLRQGSRRAMLR